MEEHPVRLLVADDLERSRLTVFFRLLLAIPHLIWLTLWGIAALFATIANWFATLFSGTSPEGLHSFLARYVKYATQLHSYLYLAANPYPSFDGRDGYPIDLVIGPPQRQNRWTVGFRLILAVPALLLGGALAGSPSVSTRSGGSSAGGLLVAVALLAWFAILARGRQSRGLRDAAAYSLCYAAQLWSYLFLLTERYPDSSPERALPELPVRSDPVDVEAGGELRRSRLTVFFRLLLSIPHLIWLALWGIVVLLAAIASWFATLASATTPASLHRFISRYVRYQTHVYGFLYLIANPFPGFTGAVGSYPLEALIDGPRVQNRWKVGFRLVLAIPAVIVGAAYGGVLFAAALLGWFTGLFTARMPHSLRGAGALAIRYHTQTSAYLLLLTDAYPYSGPFRRAGVEAQMQPAPVPFPEAA